MKISIYILLISLLFLSCKDASNPINTDPPNPYSQKEIDWPSLQKAPWPMYRHDPQLTGRSKYIGPSKGVISDTIRTSGTASLSAISIDNNGTIYCSITGGDTNLVALSSQGVPLWGISLSLIKPTNTPTLLRENNILHISANGVRNISPAGKILWTWVPPFPVYQDVTLVDKEGYIYCIDNKSTLYKISPGGNLVWSKTDSHFLWGSGSTPSFSPDGLTLYISGFLENGPAVIAVDIAGGNVRWTYGESGVANAPVVDNNGFIYKMNPVKGNDSLAIMYSISPSGTLRWKYEFPVYKYSNGSFSNIDPTIDKAGNLYFVFQDTIRSLNNEGKEQWKSYIGNKVITSPLICDNDGNTYFATTDFSSNLLSFSSIGTKRWELSLNKTLNYLTLIENKLIVTTYFGEVFMVE